jgi:hypothetical protein
VFRADTRRCLCAPAQVVTVDPSSRHCPLLQQPEGALAKPCTPSAAPAPLVADAHKVVATSSLPALLALALMPVAVPPHRLCVAARRLLFTCRWAVLLLMASTFASCSFHAKPACESRLDDEQHTNVFHQVRLACDNTGMLLSLCWKAAHRRKCCVLSARGTQTKVWRTWRRQYAAPASPSRLRAL